MRYGHQPLSEIEALSLDDIEMWAEELVELIKLENATGSRDSEYED